MKKQFLYLFLASIVVFTSCKDDDDVEQPQQQPNPVANLDYKGADHLLRSQGFVGSALVRKDGKDVLRQGYGMADKAAAVPNSPELVYRIGSMTKAFTAMGILQLKRDGLIESFDQPLSDFDDEFPRGNEITLRHLLTHHSGIRDYVGAIEDQPAYYSPEEILEIIAESIPEDGLQFDPGSKFSYSNSNYLILGLLIEELSGQGYHAYLKEKILDPLGMENTGRGPDEMNGLPYARGYNQGQEVAPYTMDIPFSAGDMISTLGDMEIWADALMGDSWLSPAEKADMFAEVYTEDGYYTIGFGWFTISIEGKVMYFHGGDIDGYTSLLAMLPEEKGLIVLLSNEQDKGEQRNLIQEALATYEF